MVVFRVSKFFLLSSFCLFCALVFLLSLCFSTSWSLKRYPPGGVSGLFFLELILALHYVLTATLKLHLFLFSLHYIKSGSELILRCVTLWLKLPDLPFIAFLGKKQGKALKKAKDCFSPLNLWNPWERREKRSKRQGNSLQKRKKQGNPKKQGKEDQG